MTTLTTPIASAKSSDLVFVSQTNELVTDSFLVADYFGKRHEQVLRKLKDIGCSADFTKHNFVLCHKNNELQNGKIQPFYQMTKDGFMFLVMGFTGKRAAEIKERYINAFNEMQNQLNNKALPTPNPSANCRILLTIENGQATSSHILPGGEFLTSPDKLSKQISESFMLFSREQLQDIALECLSGVKRIH